MKLLTLFVLAVTFLWRGKALICWVCENEPSNEECLGKGKLLTCQSSQNACQNEVRYEHGEKRVTKRCKQDHACGNNYYQNKQPAWEPAQCNDLEIAAISICRCCCDTDRCNSPEHECIGSPANPYPTPNPICDTLKTPDHGSQKCTPETENNIALLETVCRFKCDRGYVRVGARQSTCLIINRRPAFDNPAPYCMPNPACPLLRTPKYGSTTCDVEPIRKRYPVGTVCKFACREGFILRGPYTSVCLRTPKPTVGKFSHKPPQCRPNPRCDPIGSPESGSVSCSKYSKGGIPPGSVCTFACDRGYVLEGDLTSTCLVGPKATEAHFNNPVPTCVPNPQCFEIQAPRFGSKRCSQDDILVDIGTVCTFKCDKDYELVGDTESTCVKGAGPVDANFDNPTPTCRPNPKCDILEAPQFGLKECGQDGPKVDPGTECYFECNEGYLLFGQPRSTCLVGSRPTVANFEYPTPTCRPDPKCDRIGAPQSGTVSCRQQGPQVDPGTTCFFQCDDGYILIGNTSSTCVVGPDPIKAEFNNPIPSCQPDPKCTRIEAPRWGSRTCTQSGNLVDPETVCNFECNPGYNLEGATATKCVVGVNPTEADWDEDIPRCIPNPQCPIIGTPQFGSKRCTQDAALVDPGTVCSFDCNEGYVLVGDRQSTCQANEVNPLDSEFDNPVPFCEANPKCPLIGIPIFGTRDCQPNENPTVDPGTICTFECKEGYVLDGSLFSVCRAGSNPLDAAFNNPVPTCTPNPMCDLIGIPDFGSRTCTQEKLRVIPGTVCTFECSEGYILQGDAQSTCIAATEPVDSAFNNPVPTCIPNPMCDLIGIPNFGSRSCTLEDPRVPPDTVCNFQCDDGYILRGSENSTCVANVVIPSFSRFDNPVPVCSPDPMCTIIGDPEFGSKTCTQDGPAVDPGTICRFQCEEGYILEGSRVSTCIAAVNPVDSAFNNPVPTCTPNPMCDLIGTPTFGTKTCTQLSLRVLPGTVCSFTCDDGYLLIGSVESTCVAADNPVDSTFNNPVPVCSPDPVCRIIDDPENGSKTCNESGDVVSPGTECTFECNDGYELFGSQTSTCRAAPNPINSAFDNPVPVCRPNPMCDLIGIPPFGARNCRPEETPTVRPRTVCTFTCDAGYQLEGSRISTCRAADNPLDSAFDNPVPTCRPNPMCNLIGTPQFGAKSCQPVATPTVPPDTVCSFACNAGYVLEGSSESTCREATNPIESAFDNPVPVCRRNPMCDLIEIPQFGTRSCQPVETSTVPPDTVCSFACDPGYQLRGSKQSTCREAANPDNSRFDNPVPVCRPNAMCDLIGIPDFGTRSCQPVETPAVPPRTVCSFACDDGYILDGSRRSTCIEAPNPIDSAFNNPVPVCTPNPMCDLIGIPDFGTRSCQPVETSLVPPDTVCSFTCNAGYELEGSFQSTCREASNPTESTFDNPLPVCIPNPMCKLIGIPQFGTRSCQPVETATVPPDTLCSFTCNDGYLLQGFSESTCREASIPLESAFDNPMPVCSANPMCELIGRPEFGTRDCSPQSTPFVSPGTVCDFTCDDGYRLIGSRRSTCRSGARPIDAEFDNDVPTCQPDPMCALIGTPVFGSKTCNPQENPFVSPGNTCTFSCDDGYILNGNLDSTCDDIGPSPLDAAFNNPVPTCNPNPKCDLIGTPEFGSKACSPEETPQVNPGTTCDFVCDDGYVLDGDLDSTCEDVGPSPLDAAFNNPVPTCRPEPTCDTFGPLQFGTITCSQNGATVAIGTDCQFECNDGYVRVGADSSRCVGDTPELLTASFDNTLPICRAGECDEIKPILNGEVTCTRQNQIGSVCTFACDTENGYMIFPSNYTQTECRVDTATWSTPNPCCVLSCPTDHMDLVMVLDSSASITQANWDKLLVFLDRFIATLDIGFERTMVSVFTYSTVVTRSSAIELTDNKRSLRRRVSRLEWIAGETYTGKALSFARRSILKHEHEDINSVLPGRHEITDVVLLITDGASDDNAVKQANRLRDGGAVVYTVGVQPGGLNFIDQDELAAIAGSPDRVLFVAEGYQALDDEIAMLLMSMICGEPYCPM